MFVPQHLFCHNSMVHCMYTLLRWKPTLNTCTRPNLYMYMQVTAIKTNSSLHIIMHIFNRVATYFCVSATVLMIQSCKFNILIGKQALVNENNTIRLRMFIQYLAHWPTQQLSVHWLLCRTTYYMYMYMYRCTCNL